MRSVVSQAIARTHLSKDTQDIVRLGAALIATIAGLVLGLLIAAAKSSYDTQSGQVRPITAEVILLNNLLAQYGPEAFPIRQQIKFAVHLWPPLKNSSTPRRAGQLLHAPPCRQREDAQIVRLMSSVACRLSGALAGEWCRWWRAG